MKQMTTHGYTIPSDVKPVGNMGPDRTEYFGRITWCGKKFSDLERDYSSFVSPHLKEVDCKDCLEHQPKDIKPQILV